MEKKMTYVMALENALGCEAITGEVREKLEALKTSLAKKSDRKAKPTEKQKQNMGLKDAILAYMEQGKKYTITELIKGCEAISDLTNQRVSALVKQLKDDGLVVKTEEKRVAYFEKVEVDDLDLEEE